MKKILLLLVFCFVVTFSSLGQVIDMHLHSYTEKDFWKGKARNGLESSKTALETLAETIRKMDEHNIQFAVVSGTMESLER